MKKKIKRFVDDNYNKIFRRKNKNCNPTFISQNCIGGVLYSMLGLEFTSPTINMFIEDENFVKLVENLDNYLNMDATPKEEHFIDPIDNNIIYPKISVGDIELCCLHYNSCAEAVEKWNQRRLRVDLDNVYIIANTWNLHNRRDLVDRLLKTDYKIIIFSTGDYPYSDDSNIIKLKGDFWYIDSRGMVRPNLIRRYFEKQFDFVKWINE